MKFFAIIFVLLMANITYAGPSDILGLSCYKTVTGEEPKTRGGAPVPPVEDKTPAFLEEVRVRKVDIEMWRELNSLNKARTARLVSNGLSESALGTKTRMNLGRILELLDNGQKYEVVDQHLWIWDEVVRIYRFNEDAEGRIKQANIDMKEGRLSVEEAQEVVETLRVEIAENQLAYVEPYHLYEAIERTLRSRGRHAPQPEADVEATGAAGAAHAKVRALAVRPPGPGDTTEVVAGARAEPAPGTDLKKTREGRSAEAAAYALRKLNERAKILSEMFPNRGFTIEMPTRDQLRDYHRRSVDQNILYKRIEAKMDRRVSIKLFFMSASVLAPARWAIKKFLPLTAQAHVFNMVKLGEDNAAIVRYTPDIFNVFKVDRDKQVSELRDRNAPTEDQLLVTFGRLFPRTFVRIMIEAREGGKQEAGELGEKIPEDLTVVPDERMLSPQMNFYFRMVTALRAAQIRDLSLDHHDNVGQRVAVYVTGGTALLGGLGYTAYQNWGYLESLLTSVRAYLGF